MTSSIIITARYLDPTNFKGARISLTCKEDPRWTRVIILPVDYSARSFSAQVAEYLVAHGIAPDTYGSIKQGEFAVVVPRLFWREVADLFSNLNACPA